MDRALFVIALLGVLVTAHLLIQQQTGFDQGCLGFSAPSSAADGCVAVAESPASTVFGIPNALWGVLFYLVIAAISFGVLSIRGRRVRHLRRLRAALVGMGFIYTAYLVYYQAAVIEAFCELCLVSAGVETLMLLLVITEMIGSRHDQPARRMATQSRPRNREPALTVGVAILVFALVGLDFLHFSGQEEGRESEVETNGDFSRITSEHVDAICRFDPDKPAFVDYLSLVSSADPFAGNPAAPVVVIEFFDPNCTHCRGMYGVLKEVSGALAEDAMFVYKPLVLWPFSVDQSAALYAAAGENLFFEMLDLQFARQQRGGLPFDSLTAFADRIGMDTDRMTRQIRSGVYRPLLEQVRLQGQQAGVTAVPAVMINGRWVDSRSRTAACLAKLVIGAAAS